MPMPPETVRTTRLLLRRFAREDGPAIVPLIGDFAIADMTARISHPYTLADAHTFFDMLAAQPERAVYAVTCGTSGALMGAIGLDPEPAHDRAELGYWIGRPYWNKGYATEAGAAMLRLAFTELGLHRVTAHHYTRNPASGRVLEKIGMRREGLLIGHMKKWGGYEDCVAYGATHPDYAARMASSER